MKLSRRNFLKWASLSTIGAVACNIFREGEMELQSPVDLPEDQVTGIDNWYATVCGQCPEREGILVRVVEGRAKKVRGNPIFPTNQGKQSVRCDGALQAIYHPDRVTQPLLRKEGTTRGGGEWWEISWDEVRDEIFPDILGRRLRDTGRSDAMLMVTPYMRGSAGKVVNSFVKAYGGRHMAMEAMDETNLRRSVQNVLGQDRLPDFDIENSNYVISFGADWLSTWLAPVRFGRGYGHFRHNRGKARGTLVHVDSRFSMTAANADDWIPVAPGMEGAVALAMAYVIVADGRGSADAVERLVGGHDADALEAALGDYTPEKIVDPGSPTYAGIPPTIRGEESAHVIRRVAMDFATHGPSLAFGGGSAGAQTHGEANLSAILALNHLVADRVPGRLGNVIFNPDPPMRGLMTDDMPSSLSDWNKAVDDVAGGGIGVVMVYGSNPVYGIPLKGDGSGLGDAISGRQDPNDLFVIAFANVMDDTAALADLVLPIREGLEDWGDDVPEPGPGYQIVAIQQPVVDPLPGIQAESFPEEIIKLSKSLGLNDGLPNSFRAMLQQNAADLFNLNRGTPLEDETPGTIDGFWNKLLQRGGWSDPGNRSRDLPSQAPDLKSIADGLKARRLLGTGGLNSYVMVPFLSNSLMDGRNAHLPWLQGAPDPLTSVAWQTWVEVNLQEARRIGLEEGDVVNLITGKGSVEAVVYIHPAMPPGVVGVPVGQGHTPGVSYWNRSGERQGSNPLAILEYEEGMDSLPWGATQVVLQPTGRNIRVAKFEGIVPAYPIGTKEEDIVHVTNDPEA
jgi:anaerobic selenocysteine-containing dehydrogenase